MGIKSKKALQFTVEDMGEKQKELYLWTFTFAEVLDLREAVKRWSAFLGSYTRNDNHTLLKCFPDVAGIRVFELHPGTMATNYESHGLHIHCVVDKRLPVDIVRTLAIKRGLGRIHVKAIPADKALYVGKYLNKARCDSMKGVRLWAPFGACDAHQVRDIQIETRWTATYQFLSHAVAGFKSLPWVQRSKLATEFMYGGDIGKLLRVQPPKEGTPQEAESEEFARICAGEDDEQEG